MKKGCKQRGMLLAGAAALLWAPLAHAAEHVTLRNGFELDCVKREPVAEDSGAAEKAKIRLYFASAGPAAEANYMDVDADAIVKVETVPDAAPAPLSVVVKATVAVAATLQPTAAELGEMLGHAGAQHNIDADLLASLVHAESGGRAHAVSRTGARGLMQLMPGTAAALGVQDAFVPAQNVEGGTRYFDQLLTRYHDNIALALAAYNAGPGAVDRYHGVPPFHETRAYVTRVIREFNRRKTLLMAQKPGTQKLIAQNRTDAGTGVAR